jgi:hypothetical protein
MQAYIVVRRTKRQKRHNIHMHFNFPKSLGFSNIVLAKSPRITVD